VSERHYLYLSHGSPELVAVTEEEEAGGPAGAAAASDASGAVVADVNGDGWLDVLVVNAEAAPALYLNDGSTGALQVGLY
jgi:hypothetical protein